MAGNTINIIGEDRFASIDWLVWSQAYYLARRYGWEPAGTEGGCGIEAPDYDSRYFVALGQLVTAADAKALAEAITKAMPDIPSEPTFGFAYLLRGIESLHMSERLTEDFLEFFASDPEARHSLREIEALAREGEFRIE